MDRTPIGIRGLDELIEGGVPCGSWTLISGENGTGKTVAGMEFIWQGLCAGETCLFEITDQPVERIRTYSRSFGWDLSPFEKTQQLHFHQLYPCYTTTEDPRVTYVIGRASAQTTRFSHAERLKAQHGTPLARIVVDNESLTLIRAGYDEEMRALEWARAWAMKHSITGLRCMSRDIQDPHAEAMLRQYHDNIIELRLGDAGRELRIVKMFATEHPIDWIPFEITREGLRLRRKHISPMGYTQYNE